MPPVTTKYISPLGSKSTIDLVFTSAGLTESIQMCDVVEALDHDSDHLPIETILDLRLQNAVSDTWYFYDQTKQDSKSRGTKQAYVTYRNARACKKWLAQSTLRQHHRKQIEEATRDANKTWKLVQWIQNLVTPYLAFALYMKWKDGTKVFTRTRKAECLAESFFSQVINTDLEDIGHTAYPDPVAFPTPST